MNFNVNYHVSNDCSGEELAAALATVVSQIGISFEEATRHIVDLTTALNNLQNRVCVCESEIFSCIRSELDALTEKSNQKEDLEKISPIVPKETKLINTQNLDDWYDNFLKELCLHE